MKKVLFVINSHLANAGVPNVLMQIVRSLKDEFSFDIIVGSSKQGFYDEEFLSYGGQIFRHDLQDYSKSKLGYFKRGKQTANMVKSVLKQSKYNVIHCNNGEESGYALKVAKAFNVPVRIAHSHGKYFNRGKNIPARLYKHIGKKYAVKYSTHRFACSNIAGETLFLGKPFQNVLNPLNVDNYLQVVKREHDYIGLLQIGYYYALKNQLFSVKVLDEIKNNGYKAKLRFIGFDNGSGYIKKVENQVKNKNLCDDVEFLPSDYDKLKVFEETDFLLLPSTSEGLPLVALESQSSNTYCLASNNVPNDVDMGLFSTLKINEENSASVWARFIIENKDKNLSVNKQKLQTIKTEEYIKKIVLVYNKF